MKTQEQTLWARINEVAELMKDVPMWKRGSAVNERTETAGQAATCYPGPAPKR